MWLLILFTLGADPEIVKAYPSSVACRAAAVHQNSTHPSHDNVPDPKKRFACFALDSIA